MHIGKPLLDLVDGQVRCETPVDSAMGRSRLWYAADAAHGEMFSPLSDAQLIGLLIPAMAEGGELHLEGAVSEPLLYHASGPLQSILRAIIPSLKAVTIRPREVYRHTGGRASGVASGFSAGIDSYCLLADHHFSPILDAYTLTHLIFSNVGSHGRGGEQLFHHRSSKLIPLTERLGLPLLKINSNLDDFYAERASGIRSNETLGLFQQTHTLRNASVALLLQSGIGRYLFASTYTYADTFIGPSCSTAYSDPVLLPMLCTDTLDACSTGSQYSRADKTLRVAEVPESYDSLDVCVNPDHAGPPTNCSTCWKCLRTLATLDIAGALERYTASFDLAAYRKLRAGYLAGLDPEDPFARDILHLARKRGFAMPAPPPGKARSSRRSSLPARLRQALIKLPRQRG